MKFHLLAWLVVVAILSLSLTGKLYVEIFLLDKYNQVNTKIFIHYYMKNMMLT